MTRLLISGLVAWENLGYITYFSTQQEISCPVLNSRKSLEFICVIKFGNSRFIFRTETGREAGSLKWVGLRRDGKGPVLDAWDEKFSKFFWKKLGTGKSGSGMQTL